MAFYEEQLANNVDDILSQYFLICGDWGKDIGRGMERHSLLEDKDYGNSTYPHVKNTERVSYYRILKDDFYLGETLKLDQFRGLPDVNLSASGIAPMFYLPYKKNGLTRMKLSRPAGQIGPDVNFFATATIDGCSVYVEGDRTSPKVVESSGEFWPGGVEGAVIP